MRRLIVAAGLALLVAVACGEASSVPSTTTSSMVTTTTTESTTTTTVTTTVSEPECVEREGVLYDIRGFVCPPTMKPGRWDDEAAGYLAGTFTTRIFEPGFSFTRGTTFRSSGENVYQIVVDEPPNAYVAVMYPEAAAEYRALSTSWVSGRFRYPEEEEWLENLTVSEVEYWGYPGSQIDFTVGSCAPLDHCDIKLESLIWQQKWPESDQVRVLVIDIPGGPIGMLIVAHKSRFDQYWTEVVEPILASIEFLDQ